MGKAGAKAMTQGALAQALSESTELKKSVCAQAVKSLAEIGTQQVKSAGKFVIPGLCTQDALEASDKSWKERSLWQGRHGEGQASQDRGESIPCVGIEEGILSCHPMISSTLPVEKTRGATIRHG